MPQARRSTQTRQRSFKEPAALKRLNKSLDAATDALGDLRKEAGRNASKGTRDLHKELRSVVSSARRYSGRLATTLEREFDRAQKQLSERVTATTRKVTGSSGRSASSGGTRRASSGGTRRASSSGTRRTASTGAKRASSSGTRRASSTGSGRAAATGAKRASSSKSQRSSSSSRSRGSSGKGS